MSTASLFSPESLSQHERCWDLRHRDPVGYLRAVDALPEGPLKTYLMARVAFGQGRLDDCLRLCDEAEDGLVDLTLWHARLLETRGNTLNVLALDDEAQRMLAQAESLYRVSGDQVGLASVKQNIATLRFQSDETARALYLEALEMARTAGEPVLEGTILLNLCLIGAMTGASHQERFRLIEEAHPLLEMGSPGVAVRARAMQLELAVEDGDLDLAGRIAETLPDPLQVQDSSTRSTVVHSLAQLYRATRRPEAAVTVLERALTTDMQSTDIHALHAARAEALEECGRVEDALAASKEAYRAVDALRSEQGSASARALDVWHRTALLQQDRLQEKQRADALEQALAELRVATRRIHELSIRDSLTQLHNRQHLMDAGPRQLALAHPGTPAQVALIDLDCFKQINDTRGHAAGDAVLRSFAELLRERLPETDLIARYGGEEFVVLRPPAPGSTRSLTTDLDALRGEARVSRARDVDGTTLPGVSLSVGVVVVERPDLAGALVEADHRMYAAKRSGGDRVCDQPQHGPGRPSRTSEAVPAAAGTCDPRGC